ncbi:MAG: hypothetical protein EOP54_31075 [Sphingobacteriales bacterium]|nr:MAG: hypothetical protein EOP54_31075 [Sphingobacteriales bacterium]
MKTYIITALAIIALASCSDNDNAEAGMEGTWKLTTYTLHTAIDVNNDTIALNSMLAETGCYGSSNMVFDAESGVIVNDEDFHIEAETNAIVCDTLSPVSGSYSRADQNVTVTAGGASTVFVKSGEKLTTTFEGANPGIKIYFKQ